MSKKILIISIAAGSGHIRAAQALAEYAQASLPDISAEHINISDIANPLIKLFNQDIFELSIENWPKAWGKAYEASDNRPMASVLGRASKLQRPFNYKVSRYLKSKNPEGVIFTHPSLAQIMAASFRRYSPEIKLSLVATDYHVHSFYNASNIDRFFVANQNVKNNLLHAGVSEDKISITGIPINPRFYLKQDINELKRKYKIDNGRPTVLFIASWASGLLSESELVYIIKQLLEFKPEINLIFLASGNKEAYDTAVRSFPGEKRLLTEIWTDAIDEYMKISDIVISKAGGITVSECLSLNKPMIIFNPMPGQEERNAEFVEENNFGVKVDSEKEIVSVLSKAMALSKDSSQSLAPKENPCTKIFQYFE